MLINGQQPPTEGVFHTEPTTECFINQRCLGIGVLYVAQSRLFWAKNDDDSSFSLDYTNIAVHAVCRDVTQFPRPHVYVMVDSELFPEDREESSDDEDETDPEPKCTSMRFVPQNLENLQVIYKAISDCQILHPPEEQESDNEPPDDDDEDAGEYDLQGALPAVHYENLPYEQNMENGLGEVVGNGHVTACSAEPEEDEVMDHDQFEAP